MPVAIGSSNQLLGVTTSGHDKGFLIGPSMYRNESIVGKRFGKLVVLSLNETPLGHGRHWLCRCDCGGECVRRTSALNDKSHSNKSCGCEKKVSIAKASAAAWAVTTKFSHPHKEKLKWMRGNMVRRCHTPGTRRYERYGGRGITVCEEWRTNPTAFFEWAVANGYQPGLTIERINRDGNYEPANCRFATNIEQQANTSRSRFLTWNGKTQTVTQWAREFDVTPQSLQHRVDRGWPVERILGEPVRATA